MNSVLLGDFYNKKFIYFKFLNSSSLYSKLLRKLSYCKAIWVILFSIDWIINLIYALLTLLIDLNI